MPFLSISRSHIPCNWAMLIGMTLCLNLVSVGADDADRDRLRKPVHRVAKKPEAKVEKVAPQPAANGLEQKPAGHPLDEALAIARQTLDYIEKNVQDYSCVMVKRERINGTLQSHEFMNCKIRHQREADNSPFSVYLGFRKPDAVKGREVLYVRNHKDSKLVAHEGGFKGRLVGTVELDPESVLAMRGNKYPITEIGIKTLTKRLIEKGERDKKLGQCIVRILKGAKVRKRVCTCIEVKHLDRKPQHDFHVARIFIDNEKQVPIRYEAYDWPANDQSKPPLLEEYTYMNLRLNVGLVERDFDRANPQYNFN